MKRAELAFTAALVPLDFLLIFAAAFSAYRVRFGWFAELRPVLFTMPIKEYLVISAAFAALFVVYFAFAGLYGVSSPRRLRMEVSRIFLACSTGIMTVIAVFFFRAELFNSRFIVLAAWAIAVVYVTFGRIIVRLLQRLLLRFGIGTHRVALIGDDDRVSSALVQAFSTRKALGYAVVKRFRTLDDAAKNEIDALAKTDGVDEIIVAGGDMSRESLTDMLGFAEAHHLGFKYTADLLATHAKNIDTITLAGHPMVEIKDTRLDGWGRIYKRAFDILGSIALIMLITAIAIVLDSRGPVFFRLDDGSPSLRIGEHGKPFRYLKFRSMRFGTHQMRYNELAEKNEREDGPLVKIKDDPRITRVGAFIRKFSIDELAELFLVLKGDMSLVGPRPHLPEEVAKYTDAQRRVLSVKPGITGMAQVSGRADLTFDEEVRLDTYYIEDWSPWLDLIILLKTPYVVFSRKGAY
jgi:exopolysaccharide biosynthesis polyprenyl glycosylphosphotransferase